MGESIRRRDYAPAFKVGAVRLVLDSGRTIREAASDLGMSHWTLRDWCQVEKRRRRGGVMSSTDEGAQPKETPEEVLKRLKKENAQLRRKVSQLEMDREILKKAAAFFAKEQG
jgi:transposase